MAETEQARKITCYKEQRSKMLLQLERQSHRKVMCFLTVSDFSCKFSKMYPFKETLNVIVGSDAGGCFRKKKKAI